MQPALEVPYLDAAGRRSVLRCPPLPSPLHLLGGVLSWDALTWTDRLSVLRARAAAAGGAAELRLHTAKDGSSSSRLCSFRLQAESATGNRRAVAHAPRADGTAARVAVGAAGGGGAEPVAGGSGGGAVRPRARPDVRPRSHRLRDGAAAAPAARDVCRFRRSATSKRAAARCASTRWRGSGSTHGRVAGIEVRGEPLPIAQAVAAVPWFALDALLTGDTAPMAATIGGRIGHGVQADRHGQPLVRPRGDGRRVRRAAGARDAVGVRQAAGVRRARVAPVAGRRAAPTRWSAPTPPRSSRSPRARWRRRFPARATPCWSAAPSSARSARRSRSPPASRRGRASTTPVRGLFLAGDWIETGLPGTIESAAVAGHLAARAIANRQSSIRQSSIVNRQSVNRQSAIGNHQ